jgi:hypothetical protein
VELDNFDVPETEPIYRYEFRVFYDGYVEFINKFPSVYNENTDIRIFNNSNFRFYSCVLFLNEDNEAKATKIATDAVAKFKAEHADI